MAEAGGAVGADQVSDNQMLIRFLGCIAILGLVGCVVLCVCHLPCAELSAVVAGVTGALCGVLKAGEKPG